MDWKLSVNTLLTTATTRPSQSTTGAPDAPVLHLQRVPVFGHHGELVGSTRSAVDRPDRRRFWPDIQNGRPAGQRNYSRLLQRRSSNRHVELQLRAELT